LSVLFVREFLLAFCCNALLAMRNVIEWSGIDQMDAPAIIGLMLQSQYYDVLRDIGAHGAKTVFIPSSPNNVPDVSAQIRDAMMQAQAVAK
jgi:hypothetical protein